MIIMNIRQSEILELVEKNDRVTISEIKEKFGVSEMTVRRDLVFLEENGFVTRVHGGVLARPKIFLDHSFTQRERENIDAKRKIAVRATGLADSGENLMLDTGTTTLYLARELVRENKHVSVATTSLAVAYTLFNSEIDVLLFGGFLRREIPDLVGPLTERNLEGFHADKLFMGCDGLTVEEGFFTSDLNISTIEAKMVKSAGQVIVLTDSSKFGKKSFVKFAGHEEIDTVVTDGGVDAAVVDGFRERGVEVIIDG